MTTTMTRTLRLVLPALLMLVLVACESTPPLGPDVDVPEYSTTFPAPVEGVEYENLSFCTHSQDETRNFYFHKRVKSFTERLFGQAVTTYTFTLLDDTPHFLSNLEFQNYVCVGV